MSGGTSDLPIGVFDSGIGGLTVVRQIRRVDPSERIVYLGDTARVPYGTKSPATVMRFACEDAEFLLRRGVKALVVACNTASAWALPSLRERYDVPVFGVILPGARAACARTRTGRIGVIGTNATVRSGAYPAAIAAINPRARVWARACPLLVPLAEEGWANHAVTRAVLREYLRPLLRARVDTIVLGCTHYPLLKSAIRKVAGDRVALIDSAESCARYVKEELDLGGLRRAGDAEGDVDAYVTDELVRFDVLARRFLKTPIAARLADLRE